MNIIFFTRGKEEKVDVETGVYDTKNKLKSKTFKYEQGRLFFLGVAKSESKY